MTSTRRRRRPATDDESVGAFTTRRFGEAFTRRIAQPLLGGIHAGDVDRLSLRALFPAAGGRRRRRRQRARRCWRRAPAPPDGEGAFRGLRGGMGQLPAALTRALPGARRCARASRSPGSPRPAVSRRGGERPRGRGAGRGAGRAGGGRGAARRAVRPDARRRVRRAARRVERDRHARLSARSRRASLQRDGLHRAARRVDSPARGVVGVVEVGRARAARLGRAARLRRRRLRRRRPRGQRRRAGRADPRRPGADPGHQRAADVRPPASVERRQPAVRGRPPGAPRTHRASGRR